MDKSGSDPVRLSLHRLTKTILELKCISRRAPKIIYFHPQDLRVLVGAIESQLGLIRESSGSYTGPVRFQNLCLIPHRAVKFGTVVIETVSGEFYGMFWDEMAEYADLN